MKDLFNNDIQSVNPQQSIFKKPISTIGYDQEQMILDILQLHCKTDIQLDPTYSIGGFYQGLVKPPAYKFDLNPQVQGVKQASSDSLPLHDESITTMMYDPPFMASGYNNNYDYKMTKRFGTIENMGRLFDMYHASLVEFHRILQALGILIFKCQDCVDGRYNYMTHVEVMNMAVSIGFYPRDLFILLSKTRIITGQKQVHARKFHCYFWVFQKKPCYVKYFSGGHYQYNE